MFCLNFGLSSSVSPIGVNPFQKLLCQYIKIQLRFIVIRLAVAHRLEEGKNNGIEVIFQLLFPITGFYKPREKLSVLGTRVLCVLLQDGSAQGRRGYFSGKRSKTII